MYFNYTQSYIGGSWRDVPGQIMPVTNPASEAQIGEITLTTKDVANDAILSARHAFSSYSQTSKDERIALMKRVIAIYESKIETMGEHIRLEMGAPHFLAHGAQVGSGLAHLQQALKALENAPEFEVMGNSRIYHEPVGVCALITPWNWPMNQIACKVGPALAAGCTMVLKPSELAPLSAYLFAQILDEAGVPPGVFNLVNGDGATVGSTLSEHPEVDMVSFTGSTQAGVSVAIAAAPTVKRVSQELGGKSANIMLDDIDVNQAIKDAVVGCMHNTGQSCNAPTRLLIPAHMYDKAVAIAADAADAVTVGNTESPDTFMGPLISQAQFDKVQTYIRIAIEEGAKLVAGGMGKPAGIDNGFFAKPTVFAGVTNTMRIAREEVFGPVLVLIPYDSEAEAIAIANDTPYGLSGYITSASKDRALSVAKQLRCGMVHVNGSWTDPAAPFGGYKQSGNGREWGKFGLEEFQEVKSLMGFEA
ncbi:MAG: aldehyde dehydrogenase family protein [Alteromonadaceae bacterium]|nr:aldehyde dehydrogenase family protein [Alteromonadaceae bacterium]